MQYIIDNSGAAVVIVGDMNKDRLKQAKSFGCEVVDLTKETEETKKLYGIDRAETAEFGTRCLLARRMVERGVRFVQLYSGDTNGWDAHSDLEGNHGKLCLQSDKPIAGLLTDLKRKGLLKNTLVVWGGEFGRTPMTEGTNGRDHNPHGFSMWLASTMSTRPSSTCSGSTT